MVPTNWNELQVFMSRAGTCQLFEAFEDQRDRYQQYRTWEYLATAVVIHAQLSEWIDTTMEGFDQTFYRGELQCELPEHWGWYVKIADQAQLVFRLKLGKEEFIPWIEYHSELDDDIPF